MFALLIPLLASLPGIFGKFFTEKNELAQATLQAQIAIEQAKIQIAGQIAQAQLEEEKAIVGSTSPNFKYFTFCMWFGPYMLQILWPSKGLEVFANMAQMPAWYAQSCVAIMFTAWGISVSAPVVSSIFSNLSDFFAASRSDKIKLQQVSKQAVFDAIRHIKGNVTNADVKLWDPVIDEVNKEL